MRRLALVGRFISFTYLIVILDLRPGCVVNLIRSFGRFRDSKEWYLNETRVELVPRFVLLW